MERNTLARGFLALAVLGILFSGSLGALRADDPETGAEAEAEEGPIRTIKIDAENWEWIPDKIIAHRGDHVVLKVRSFHATHRFDLKEYGLKVVLPQDQTTTIEFVADKVGEFKFRCGRPCGDGCPRMRGLLTVLGSASDHADP